MIKALRRKFILTTMALLFAVLVIMLTLLNIAVRNDRRQTALNEMYALSAASRVPRFMLREDSLPPASVPEQVTSSQNSRGRRSWTDDMAFKEMYTVLLSEKGHILQSSGVYDFGLPEEEVNALTVSALKSSRESGRIGQYMFLKVEKRTGSLIVFRNISEDISANRKMLANTVLIGLGTLTLLLVITFALSHIVTQPAERAFSQQKQFIADASHELKTPLSAVSVNAEVLKEEIGSNKWLDNIILECRRMEELVLSLLTLAKLDAGEKKTVTMEKQSISAICNEAVLSFESLAYEKRVELSADIEEGIDLSGNRSELKQLLSILIDNAFKYVDTHGTVTVSLKQKDKIVFSVSNTGPVIDPESLPHLFERFYRADSSRSGEKSFGLGLAIADEIVKRHKGTITVESLNDLTEFTVAF